MTLEEQASYLQELKKAAGLRGDSPRDQLLSELTDTVSLLCHQVSLLSEVSDGMNEAVDGLRDQMDALFALDDGEEEVMGEDEYFDGSERPLYQVSCPECQDQFAVDESSLIKGFRCPNCGTHLVQAES